MCFFYNGMVAGGSKALIWVIIFRSTEFCALECVIINSAKELNKLRGTDECFRESIKNLEVAES